MADIELVIKISEETYNDIQSRDWKNGALIFSKEWKAIHNGTPLPKGHGDLKDMDDIYEALEGWNEDTGWIVDAIDCQAPTIIEADKTESEDK